MTEYKVSGWWIIGPDGEPICQVDYALHSTYDAETNALLIADAFNVAKRTGKTPSQLVKERDEALAKCDLLLSACKSASSFADASGYVNGFNIMAAIEKAEGK